MRRLLGYCIPDSTGISDLSSFGTLFEAVLCLIYVKISTSIAWFKKAISDLIATLILSSLGRRTAA